jgi:cobalt-zinc-cadmium efflux system protein
MGHHHSHHHEISGKNIGWTIALNIMITIAQVIGGWLSGSMALFTDALHNFSDVISLLLSWFTNRLAKKEPTIGQTYGYKRAEILSAFINSVSLIAIALFLIVEAIGRLSAPKAVLPNLVIYFALASIIANLLSVLLLKKDATQSMNMKSAYLHLLTDVMTSIAVLMGGVLMKFYGLYWIDSFLSILIAIYLIYSSYQLLTDSIKILMQFTPADIDMMVIKQEIIQLRAVKNIHHVHIWQLNDHEIFFEAHIDLKEDILLTDFQDVLIDVQHILKHQGINFSNIQPEYNLGDKKDLIVQHE